MKIKILDRPINLGIVLQSHLNDLAYDTPEWQSLRLKFIKALTFFNEDLRRDVTDSYIHWLWDEIHAGRFGATFAEYENNRKKVALEFATIN